MSLKNHRAIEWLNKIRTKVECALDYAWYVGERWGKTHYGLYGRMYGDFFLGNFWLWIVLLPFIMPLLYRYLPKYVANVMSICLILLPHLFCRFRYTKKRRKALDRKYRHMEEIVSDVAGLVALCAVLAIISFRLSFYLGLFTWQKIK